MRCGRPLLTASPPAPLRWPSVDRQQGRAQHAGQASLPATRKLLEEPGPQVEKEGDSPSRDSADPCSLTSTPVPERIHRRAKLWAAHFSPLFFSLQCPKPDPSPTPTPMHLTPPDGRQDDRPVTWRGLGQHGGSRWRQRLPTQRHAAFLQAGPESHPPAAEASFNIPQPGGLTPVPTGSAGSLAHTWCSLTHVPGVSKRHPILLSSSSPPASSGTQPTAS